MKSFQKAFGVFVLAGGLAVTGASAVAPKTAVLPVEHDRGALVYERESRSALLPVEHDRGALVYERESRSALVYERESRSALIIEHDRSNA